MSCAGWWRVEEFSARFWEYRKARGQVSNKQTIYIHKSEATVMLSAALSYPTLLPCIPSRGAVFLLGGGGCWGWGACPLLGTSTSEQGRVCLPSASSGRGRASPPSARMVPAPGTPLGGERPRRGSGGSTAMEVDAGAAASADVAMAPAAAPGQRLFCPVPGCPCADATRARGWTSAATLRKHVDAHLAGSLAGRVPADWLQHRDLQRCLVCGLSVATGFGVHPTCRPTARATAGSGMARPRPHSSADGPLPSLTEIQCSNTPTLRRVPAGAKYAWAQAVTRACAAVADYNDEQAWVHLLMLPQAVLCSPPRGGRKHQRAAAAFTLERLQRWNDGERASLWASRPQPPRSSARQLTDEQRQAFAINLAREGFDRKACAALLSQGLCEHSPATVAALQALHPDSAAPAGPTIDELSVAPLLDLENVAQALRSFPADTAPGPTGLRVQHSPGRLKRWRWSWTVGPTDHGCQLACSRTSLLYSGTSLGWRGVGCSPQTFRRCPTNCGGRAASPTDCEVLDACGAC